MQGRETLILSGRGSQRPGLVSVVSPCLWPDVQGEDSASGQFRGPVQVALIGQLLHLPIAGA